LANLVEDDELRFLFINRLELAEVGSEPDRWCMYAYCGCIRMSCQQSLLCCYTCRQLICCCQYLRIWETVGEVPQRLVIREASSPAQVRDAAEPTYRNMTTSWTEADAHW